MEVYNIFISSLLAAELLILAGIGIRVLMSKLRKRGDAPALDPPNIWAKHFMPDRDKQEAK